MYEKLIVGNGQRIHVLGCGICAASFNIQFPIVGDILSADNMWHQNQVHALWQGRDTKNLLTCVRWLCNTLCAINEYRLINKNPLQSSFWINKKKVFFWIPFYAEWTSFKPPELFKSNKYLNRCESRIS